MIQSSVVGTGWQLSAAEEHTIVPGVVARSALMAFRYQQQHSIHGEWRNDGSLPPNWEQLTAEDGKHYYVDHNTRTTSWVDPRDAFTKVLTFEECRTPLELPFGWEIAIDDEVGEYFIDHNSFSTQLEDPRRDDIGRQQRTLGNFLRSERGGLPSREDELALAREDLARAEKRLHQLVALYNERPDGPTSLRLKRNIEHATQVVNDAQDRLNELMQSLNYRKEGIRILEDLGTRMGSGSYSLADARSAKSELHRNNSLIQQSRGERDMLQSALLEQTLAHGATVGQLEKQLVSLELQNAHQRETDALKRQIAMLQKNAQDNHMHNQLAIAMQELEQQNMARDGDLQVTGHAHIRCLFL